MGLFVKKKDGNLSSITGEKSIGWDAIESHLSKIYPLCVNPKHYAPIVNWRFGGNDPLDGIDIYDGEGFYHFVTYGLSELYEKENDLDNVSGYGMEFTLKLKIENGLDDDRIKNICNILQDIARITFTEGELFKEYEYLDFETNIDENSNIVGFITVPDPDLKSIDTLNGKVDFILLIGITKEEMDAIKNKKITVKDLYKLTKDITSYNRKSVV